MTMTRLVFAVVSGAYLLVAIPFEERSLRATAGGAVRRDTCSACGGGLIPGVVLSSNRIRPDPNRLVDTLYSS